MRSAPELVVFLAGDVQRQPDMQVKYGVFLEALGVHFNLQRVVDVSLKGVRRWMNLIRSFDVNIQKWKEQSFKNVFAFKLRSQLAAQQVKHLESRFGYALQIGVLFEAQTHQRTLIYTDYTAALSASQPGSGRSPFDQEGLAAWLKLERQAYHNARHIFTRSALVKDSMIEGYGLPAEKISVVGGGLNLALPPLPERAPNQKRTPTILFIGTDFWRKGGDILLQAFALLRQQIPEARLSMLTAGPIPAGLSVAGVDIIAPTWDREHIATLYRKADMFVLPSRLETWGDVLLEAMAFGLPCIGIRGQAMEEIIQDGVTGLLVAPEDPEALSQAMHQVFAQPERLAAMGKAGRQRVEKEFAWNCVVIRMKNIVSTFNNIEME